MGADTPSTQHQQAQASCTMHHASKPVMTDLLYSVLLSVHGCTGADGRKRGRGQHNATMAALPYHEIYARSQAAKQRDQINATKVAGDSHYLGIDIPDTLLDSVLEVLLRGASVQQKAMFVAHLLARTAFQDVVKRHKRSVRKFVKDPSNTCTRSACFPPCSSRCLGDDVPG